MPKIKIIGATDTAPLQVLTGIDSPENLLRIGKTAPALGGIYAGMLRNPQTGEQYHLFMHPQAMPECPWGEYGHELDGASSYWDGAANTQAMRQSGKCPDIIAALEALPNAELYHIPSQAEQSLLTANLRDMLAPAWHWTSTQCSSSTAWGQHCEDGGQDILSKDNRLAVRAVRRLPI